MSISVAESDESFYIVTFNNSDHILTTVTSSGVEVESWVSDVLRIHRRRLNYLVVGLDIEWRPNRSANQRNPVAILQLCVGRHCLIFQILYADYVPNALFVFLADSRFCFVGVGIQDDVDRLVADYGLEVQGFCDIRDLAVEETGRQDMHQMGLARLAAQVMRVRVEKPFSVRTSRWDHYSLSSAQIGYACVDAFLSFEIGRRLIAGDF